MQFELTTMAQKPPTCELNEMLTNLKRILSNLTVVFCSSDGPIKRAPFLLPLHIENLIVLNLCLFCLAYSVRIRIP